jgi:hypothetical protein
MQRETSTDSATGSQWAQEVGTHVFASAGKSTPEAGRAEIVSQEKEK